MREVQKIWTVILWNKGSSENVQKNVVPVEINFIVIKKLSWLKKSSEYENILKHFQKNFSFQ